ncbi:MAG: porin, partial [Hyphomicrobiales bacterium]|nr:porin [Hyphomicrobiales bacterium]
MKITGYITAQIEAGTLSQGYAYTTGTQLRYVPVATNSRDALGYTTRGELEFIAKNNTAYGVLTSDIDTQFNYGSGFDNTGAGNGFINHAFLNWAGITAGKANSFFSFFGGGEAWANIFSPDRQGFNQPLLLAYTASFGGGFSATISLEDPELGAGGGSTETFAGNSRLLGQRAPDIVGSLDLAQNWGGAHVSGVAHNVIAQSLLDGSVLNTWGWAIDGGVKFNLPTLGAGDNIQLQGVYSQNAIWYSGVSDGMWGENGAVNGNGIAMPVTDAFSNGNGTWATPDAWSLTAISEFHLGSMFLIDPEVSYLNINWSGVNTGLISTNQQSWIAG